MRQRCLRQWSPQNQHDAVEKHRTTLGGDILPVQRVDIPALSSPGMLAPFPLLERFDFSGGVAGPTPPPD